MNYDSAAEVWGDIQASKLSDLRQDVVDVAIRYARIRVDYFLADTEKKHDLESERTSCHNALICNCDILARNMTKHGEDATWRSRLGSDRKLIGDFACLLHTILGIAAR